MDNAQTAVPPRWYWIVAGLALLWMLFGVVALITIGVLLLWLASSAKRLGWLG